MSDDLQLAIQAAWLAGHRRLAAELAAQRDLNTCIRCGGPDAVSYQSRRSLEAALPDSRTTWWITCDACETLTLDEEMTAYFHGTEHLLPIP